ncbi:beta-ketoacyl synthase [Niabella ginsenosidivorans]|uniref:Beta-ketoacyl synthase n=1 Tax=Niabella ginsenosidivorans TaxID=1176587 RepID=A0A1A9I6F1_9BACT|nr:beta-ketoacyl synthase N-terminal-like domain-containing protein [Niabella ginsenosidivorans]ANH82905.1 beta-ketoacyl synthase [Niabella ginsenosidivorans]
MAKAHVLSQNIFSPLGPTARENFDALCKGLSAVKIYPNNIKSDVPFCAALFPENFFENIDQQFTPFEYLLKASIEDAVKIAGIDVGAADTALILSSTKGNVSKLETGGTTGTVKEAAGLTASAEKLAGYFGFRNKPVIVCHACISGTLAMITAKRLLDAGKYKTIVVAGADVITRFILSGFQSFHAVSDELCKPFDADRKGINLGEAAATVVLSVRSPASGNAVIIGGGGVSNDANHISGPSRTGAELSMAIDQAINEAGITADAIDFVSAHGTATVYNDDMESRAIHLAGLQSAPVNSLKGYYGHTLGAAGLLEAVICIESLLNNTIIPTMGFEKPGTVMPLTVCTELVKRPLSTCVKSTSGFGGCNAAVVLQKDKDNYRSDAPVNKN